MQDCTSFARWNAGGCGTLVRPTTLQLSVSCISSWTASAPVIALQIVNWREKLIDAVNFLLQSYDVVYGDDSTCYVVYACLDWICHTVR